MSYNAELIAFSQNPNGNKLATFLITMPRSILAECNTHRVLSRNAASSRAIPTRVMIERVMNDPYIPDWTRKSAGMQGKPMPESEIKRLNNDWLQLRDTVIAGILMVVTGNWYNIYDIRHSMSIDDIAHTIDSNSNAPHKQDINRPLEPWLFMEWIVSATEWDNFFFQRVHTAAHPAIQEISYRMAKLYFTTEPKQLQWGEAHLPFITEEDWKIADKYNYPENAPDHITSNSIQLLEMISAARCGRISYAKQGVNEIDKDLEWFNKHIYENAAKGEPQHVSPAEHPAIAKSGQHANYYGFEQLRAIIPGENHMEWTINDLNKYEEQTGREITKGIE